MRIETMINIVKDEEKSSKDFTFYKFETMTLCPIDTKLIDKSLLTDEEIEFINIYHKRVHEELSPKLRGKAKEWLAAATEPI